MTNFHNLAGQEVKNKVLRAAIDSRDLAQIKHALEVGGDPNGSYLYFLVRDGYRESLPDIVKKPPNKLKFWDKPALEEPDNRPSAKEVAEFLCEHGADPWHKVGSSCAFDKAYGREMHDWMEMFANYSRERDASSSRVIREGTLKVEEGPEAKISPEVLAKIGDDLDLPIGQDALNMRLAKEVMDLYDLNIKPSEELEGVISKITTDINLSLQTGASATAFANSKSLLFHTVAAYEKMENSSRFQELDEKKKGMVKNAIIEIMGNLCAHGADPIAPDKTGQSAIEYGYEKRLDTVCEALKAHVQKPMLQLNEGEGRWASRVREEVPQARQR